MSKEYLPETRELRRVLARAEREARRLRSGLVEEHCLLLGLILNDRNIGAQALAAQIDLGLLRSVVEPHFGFGGCDTEQLELSHGSMQVLGRARDEARILGYRIVNPGHLLLALLHDQSGILRDILDLVGVDLRKVRTPLMKRSRHS